MHAGKIIIVNIYIDRRKRRGGKIDCQNMILEGLDINSSGDVWMDGDLANYTCHHECFDDGEDEDSATSATIDFLIHHTRLVPHQDQGQTETPAVGALVRHLCLHSVVVDPALQCDPSTLPPSSLTLPSLQEKD